mgnify:CR=1 FL=1
MAITAPKGTRDILPEESYRWIYLEEKIRKLCALYRYEEIRTPMFEKTELFVRGVGQETDIVQKEMYTFEHRDKESFSLKPEGTAAVVRAYGENKLYSQPQPVKLYYITPCFRAERPQKGRYRQFHQFGIEVLGTKSAGIDAEVIAVAARLFVLLQIKNIKLYINSVGCGKCRGDYYEKLKAFLFKNLDALCADCKKRYEMNPMRILDCKEETCQKALQGAPFIVEYLCEECRQHFDEVKENLELMGVDYEINPRIVRGLDYYEKTAFEFVSEDIGAQGTVCGGGRYDGLSELIGGPPTPGIGFGLGLERLMMLAEDSLSVKKPPLNIYIASMGRQAGKKAQQFVEALRTAGISAEKDAMGRSLKAQMKYADKSEAENVLILGEEELKTGVAEIKNMQTGRQHSVNIETFEQFIADYKVGAEKG